MKPLPMPLYALVIDQERRTTKNGDLFWQVMLKTRMGVIKAFMWRVSQDVETHPKYPHVEDIIEIQSFDDQRADRGNIIINTFIRVTKDALPREDLCVLEVDRASEQELDAASKLLNDGSFWDNPHCHEFVMTCLRASPYSENLRKCPAAVKVHHAFQGGLLVHMGEVLQLCKTYIETTSDRYGFINRDVVYAGAILHDIGKINTYSFSELGVAQQLKSEHIIGHIFYAMYLVQYTASCKPWFDCFKDGGFIDEVLHCIAAHHGTREWGSIVEPQSLEAGIVSRMDYLSSRNGMMEKVLKEGIQSGQPLQDEFRIYGEDYFASTGIKHYVSIG